MEKTIGQRLRQLLDAPVHRMLDGEVAERVGMSAAAFSLAVNGKRNLSSLELVKLAELLKVSTHWLITGETDPFELRLAARHGYDSNSHGYVHEPKPEESELLANIALAYRQAFPDPLPVTDEQALPASAMRAKLGLGFVKDFSSRVESNLGIGIVRVPGVDKAYSLRIGGRYAIVLGTSGNWFFQNFSIGHELGHINSGHFDDPDERANDAEEKQANNFAAELLLPEELLRAYDWMRMNGTDLANFVWDSGTSTATLRLRLNSLGIERSQNVDGMLQSTTQSLLRQYCSEGTNYRLGEIAERMSAAAARRFPSQVETAHLDAIGRGILAKDTLAWMLGISPEELEAPIPPAKPLDLDALARELGLTGFGS